MSQVPVTIYLTKTRARKLARGEGIRIKLSPQEVEASGLMDWLKKGYKFVKEKVIDTKNYQKYAKPIIRHAIDLAPIPTDVKKVVDYVGKQTNAYGVKRKTKSHLVKGSIAAKEHMARLRAMRGKKSGGSFLAM